jgi:hypothetical protein
LEHAVGLPGAEGLDIEHCLRWVDEAAVCVRSKTEQYLRRFQTEPEKYDHSEGVFRIMWLVTVLQRDLHVHYRQDVIELDDHAFFSDAANLFIHGIVEGKGGTCSSLPVMFAAVGRRLGYPLKLVGCKRHGFVRWEGADGQRFNIETTCRGYISNADEFYMHWPHQTTPDEITRFKFLESETPEVEIASFRCQRGHIWTEHGKYGDAVFEHLRAFIHAPGREGIVNGIHRALIPWGKELRAQIGRGFPGLAICQGPRWHDDLPLNIAVEINYLNALEQILNDPLLKAYWWEPLRSDPDRPPLGAPQWMQATYSIERPASPIKLEVCEKPKNLIT